jgi:hypothetical protein
MEPKNLHNANSPAGRYDPATMIRCLSLITMLLLGTLAPWAHAGDEASRDGGNPHVATDGPCRLVVWYRLDTSRFRAGATGWIGPIVGLLGAAGLVPADEQPVADGLLIASLLTAYPQHVAVLDIAEPRPDDGSAGITFADLSRYRIVLEAEAPGSFAPLRGAMAAILAHYGQPNERSQTLIDLPGDREGVRYRLADWPDWLCLEWFADGERFYLGVGTGALERWLSGALPQQVSGVLEPHRQAIGAHDADSVFIEWFVDPAALHDALGKRLASTELARRWNLSRFGGAEQVMMVGRWEGTFLMLDVTTRRDGRLRHEPLTLAHWPADAGMPMPDAGFHMVAPVDWPLWVQRSQRWFGLDIGSAHRAAKIEQLLGAVRPYLLISDYPRPWLRVPGTATLYLALRPDVDGIAARKQLRDLLAPAFERLDADDLAVVENRDEAVFWLDSPLRRIIKAPAWGWATHAHQTGDADILIVSFSPQAVLMNRAMLQTPPEVSPQMPDASPDADGRLQ